MTKLQITICGEIPAASLDRLRREIEACYYSLPPMSGGRGGADLSVVELRLVDTTHRLVRMLAEEKEALGVATVGEEDFLVTHDAWTGHPRITICLERIANASEALCRAALQHEVGHTILHGWPKYYTFKFSPDLLAEAQAQGLELPVLQQALYFVSIAVKDYEVSRLLLEHSLGESQVPLALHQLEVAPDDHLAWLLAREIRAARLVYYAAQLKPLLFAWPLREVSDIIQPQAQAMLAYLPRQEQEGLLALTEQVASGMGQDTHRNMEWALRLVVRYEEGWLCGPTVNSTC